MEILRLLQRESAMRPRLLAALTVFSALATVVVIAAVSAAAEVAAKGQVSLRLAGLFVVATAMYALTQNALMGGFANEVEGIIDRIRRGLFSAIGNTELATLRQVGRAPLFAAITRDTQTISRNLPLVIIGAQQLVLVVLICLYLATLSATAFVLASVFSVVSVSVHLGRMKHLGDATVATQAQEGDLFEGLDGLIRGPKEVRLSHARGNALLAELSAHSRRAREAKTALKRHWGREFALIQLAFYCLLGLMVFVVPMFTADFHQVALPGTLAALFLIGPIGTVATAIPAIDEAERALVSIRAISASLGEAGRGRVDVAPEPLTAPVQDFALRGLGYAYPGQGGDPGFAVGPLDARFERGQLTFVTGGNGSGKSTTMQLLTGLLPAQSGDLLVNGEVLRPGQMQAWRDCISAVFSDFHLFARLYGVSPAALARADALLARLDMADKVSLVDGAFSTVELSTGQRKRLALVAALLEDKPVLILDEWAADQDPHFRQVFYEEILPELRAEGRIVICVTHDDRWFGMADQILHLNEGRIERG